MKYPSETSLNAHQQGSHYTLPEGVHFCADNLETWFNSGCVALLGPCLLWAFFFFAPPNCKRGWGYHLKLPFSWEGCPASCRQGLRSSRDGNPVATPLLLVWFSFRSGSDASSILRAKVNYSPALSAHLPDLLSGA